jgi:NDP-4-keto-2,6-dideoxyhexose 3-C-methyltransferase
VNCLSCGGVTAELFKVGNFYLCDFVDPGESPGDRHPLRLVMCETCTLVQLGDIVPRDSVITERYGFTTGLNEQNRADVAGIASYAHQHKPDAKAWLDIGCNDGTLLASAPDGVQRWGCDPLLRYDNFAEAALRNGVQHGDSRYFNAAFYRPGQFDVVVSTAMFYALDDPSAFVEGVRHVLARDGIWVIQQNYALDMIRNNTVDNIIHEHVAYYTVRSLQHLLSCHGLQIADVGYSKVKGGCFRTLVTHRGARPTSSSVSNAAQTEALLGAGQPETWTDWFRGTQAELKHTEWLLRELADKGRPAYCYGAGNRGGTLVQLLAAGPDVMPYAVERSPAKVGKVWTSAGIPIISEEQMRADKPAHLLMSPWFFRDVFVAREREYLESGGTMIFPLPHYERVTA